MLDSCRSEHKWHHVTKQSCISCDRKCNREDNRFKDGLKTLKHSTPYVQVFLGKCYVSRVSLLLITSVDCTRAIRGERFIPVEAGSPQASPAPPISILLTLMHSHEGPASPFVRPTAVKRSSMAVNHRNVLSCDYRHPESLRPISHTNVQCCCKNGFVYLRLVVDLLWHDLAVKQLMQCYW